MQVISKSTAIDFMGKRGVALTLSLTLIAVSIAAFVVRGLNYGLDFTGGWAVEVGYDGPVDVDVVRQTLEDAGFAEVQVQTFGADDDILVRLPPDEAVGSSEDEKVSDRVIAALKAQNDSVDLRSSEFVGPQVGEELREAGGLAMLFAVILIFLYVMFRFQWKFSTGAIAALVHDVIITIGFFAVFHQFSFDLSVLAAVLAVIGYSLNDTIVVFDRVRENFRTMRRGTPVEVVNASLNQVLARTIITAFTTLLVLIALLFLGGETIRSFAIALIVGIVVGTYSSIYVASALALRLDVTALELMPPKDDTPEVDAMP